MGKTHPCWFATLICNGFPTGGEQRRVQRSTPRGTGNRGRSIGACAERRASTMQVRAMMRPRPAWRVSVNRPTSNSRYMNHRFGPPQRDSAQSRKEDSKFAFFGYPFEEVFLPRRRAAHALETPGSGDRFARVVAVTFGNRVSPIVQMRIATINIRFIHLCADEGAPL